MRIGIVNDAAIAREALRRVVAASPAHEVVWTAHDGQQAIALARAAPADVILMDLIMPGTDGVEATRRIMGESPCAILVVTSSVSGNLSKVYQAMGYGALDAVDTPALGARGELNGGTALLRKIEVVGRLIGKSEGSGTFSAVRAAVDRNAAGRAASLPSLVVLGASTGGPQALAAILSGLPRSFDAAIVIVQHVDATFAPGLGQWLSEQARRPVALIEDGRSPGPGDVLLSVTDDHLVFDGSQRLRYTPEPRSASYRPSVDVFFQSVARHWPRPGAAAVLTGMFHDGAAGLLALRKLGWRTIAQDRATSVVWGMPRAAVEIGAAEVVLPIDQIAGAIARMVQSMADRP